MPFPSGTVTFLFTDVEGSTKLAQKYPRTLYDALERHNTIMSGAIESNNGFVFKTVGDAYCCAFEKAEDAVRAAVTAQLKLAAEKWNDAEIKIRIGIHTGKAEWSGNNYMGYITLARSARIMSAAYGEQILISDETHKHIKNKPGNISYRDLGERRLKDVIQPIRLFQILSPGLRGEFPPLKTLDARANNLPVQLTSFIGREKNISEIKELLNQNRLLTIVCAGGTGKTRLALQAGADLIDEYTNGVFVFEFAPVTEEELVIQPVMNSLGIREEEGKSPEDTLTEYLKEKEMLLIMDNCEHIINKCANLAELLIRKCPKIKIIATSREALNCQGEQTYRLSALSVPEQTSGITPEEIIQCESVRLFVERALTVNPGFRVTESNASALAEICRRLDGIPLAIELAAAKTNVISVEKIHQRLDDMFSLLSGVRRTVLPRQQTLRAMIDWSYNLLSEKEKILWSRLTVFSGGWTLESAEEICSDEKTGSYEILDLLGQLSQKSIISFNETNERYSMLETMKQYGEIKLEDSGELTAIKLKHLEYYSSLADRTKNLKISSPEWFSVLDPDHNNFISAIESSVPAGKPETGALITESLNHFWEIRGYYSTGLKLIEVLLSDKKDLSKNSLAKLYMNYSHFFRIQGNYEKSRELNRKSLELLRETGSKNDIIIALHNAGNTEALTGNFSEAGRIFEESLKLSRECNFISGIAFALNNLGNVALIKGDHEKAEAYTLESLEHHYKSGNSRDICFALDTLGNIMKEKGNLEKAKKYLSESLEISRQIGDKSGIAFALYNLGSVYYCCGDEEKALEYANESLKLRTEIGDKPGIAYSYDIIGVICFYRKEYDKAEYYLRESLKIRTESGDRHAILLSLSSYSLILSSGENTVLSAKLLGAKDTGYKSMDLPMSSEESQQFEEISRILKDKLGESEFIKYFDEGKKMTIDEASDAALSIPVKQIQ